jgi:hypothetical protein
MIIARIGPPGLGETYAYGTPGVPSLLSPVVLGSLLSPSPLMFTEV